MIRAVLFDLDDTLVDHQHASRAALTGVRARFTVLSRMSIDEIVHANAQILEALHSDVAVGRRKPDDARIERYRRLFAAVGEPHTLAGAAAELHRRTYQAARRAVPGALELVAALRAYVTIGVVTNNTVAEQTEKLATFGFTPWIDTLVTSEELRVAKPDPAIFVTALARLGCRADEAVMVGDSWQHDVLGAAAAGIHAVWFNRNGATHPDAAVAAQITTFEPAAEVAAALLSAGRHIDLPL